MSFFHKNKIKIYMVLILGVLYFLYYGFSDKYNYDKVYSIEFRNKNVGYCLVKTRNNEKEYVCKVFFENGGKKFEITKSMFGKGKEILYFSSYNKIKKQIKTDFDVYPFLFSEKITDKVYYPEKDKYYSLKKLGVSFFKNGFYALPFKYLKTDSVPEIFPLDVKFLKETKSEKIKVEYPIKYVISFKTSLLPPSDLRQNCIFEDQKTKCVLLNSEIIKKGRLKTAKKSYDDALKGYIDENHLYTKTDNIEEIIKKITIVLRNTLKYESVSKEIGVDEIIKLGKGDCTEFSKLSVAILNYLGVNAVGVYGLHYNRDKGKWFYHAWVEYESDSGIKAFDPTLGNVAIDVNYLKLITLKDNDFVVLPFDIDYIKFEEVN